MVSGRTMSRSMLRGRGRGCYRHSSLGLEKPDGRAVAAALEDVEEDDVEEEDDEVVLETVDVVSDDELDVLEEDVLERDEEDVSDVIVELVD